jgi:hypothetical protein
MLFKVAGLVVLGLVEINSFNYLISSQLNFMNIKKIKCKLTTGHPYVAAKNPPRGKMMQVPAGAPEV